MIKRIIDSYQWAKGKCPAIAFYSVVIFIFSQVGAVFNFITSLLILPHYLKPAEVGMVLPVTQFIAIGAIPLTVITTLVIKYITKYEANQEWGKLKQLIRDLVVVGVITTVVIAVVFAATFKSFAIRVGIESYWVLFWMVLYLCVSCWIPLISVLTRAAQRFFIIAFSGFITPLVLLISVLVLLPVYGFTGYLIAMTISTLVNIGIAAYSIYLYMMPHKVKLEPYFDDCRVVFKKYLLLFTVSAAAGWLCNFLPPFIAKHFLTDQDAGGYFVVSKLSMLPFYAFSSLMTVLLPILSIKHERGDSGERTVNGSILYTAISGLIVVVGLYEFSPWLFRVVPPWQQYAEYARYVWLMAANVVLMAVISIIAFALLAKWDFAYVVYCVPVHLATGVIMYCLFGWEALRNYLPADVWGFIDSSVDKGIYLLLLLMIGNSIIVLIILISCYRHSCNHFRRSVGIACV